MSITATDFLRELFSIIPARKLPVAWLCAFKGDPKKQSRKAWDGYAHDPAEPLPHINGANAFYSIAAFPRGVAARREDQEPAVLVLLADDVGSKVDPGHCRATLGEPSFVIETSKGNFQWGYLPDKPIQPADIKPLHEALKVLKVADASGLNAVRYARLPTGINAKPGKQDFPVHLVEWHPQRRYTLRHLQNRLKVEAADEANDKETYTPPDVLTDGERNDGCARHAGYLIAHGTVGVVGCGTLHDFNLAHCRPPLDKGEINTIWRSMIKKDGRGKRRTEAESRSLVEQVNVEHALILVTGKLFVMWKDRARWGDGVNFPLLSSIDDMRRMWLNRQVGKANPIDEWIASKDRHEFTGIVFKPGVADTGSYFNLFHGWDVEPVRGDCALLLAHLRDVVCDGDDGLFDYLIQWFANIVQFPQAKSGTAIALGGMEGSGKGAIIRYMQPFLGSYLAHLSGSDQLLGRFNDVFAGKLLLYGDEVVWPGDKKGVDKLKAYITEDRITVERKFQPQFEIDNYARLITATNRDHSAPAEINDRRYVPVAVPPHKVGDRAYWKALEAERQGGGPAALLYHLLHEVKITRELRDNPKTIAHVEQKLLGLDHIGAFWREALMSNDHMLEQGIGEHKEILAAWEFGTVVPTTVLHTFYLDYAKRVRLRYSESLDALGKALRQYLPTLSKREVRAVEQRELKVRTRTMVYELPTLAEARAAFAQAVGGEVDWPEPESAEKVPF